MARQDINIGSQANDGTGDDLRTAMQKINTNFTELYAETSVDSGITISGNTISSNRSDDDIVFEPSGVGAVRFPAVTINDNSINTATLFVNDDNITIARRWNDDSTRASSVGKSGDTVGMIAWEDDAVYVCTANFDGSTQIWRRAAISAF